MQDNDFHTLPTAYKKIQEASKRIKFDMASDWQTGSLLKTLVASKPAGSFLELGTGSGLATSWIVEGMSENARLTSVENNAVLLDIAKKHLPDTRIQWILQDGYEWIKNYKGESFDLIFADAMPGKYELFDETIALLKPGGIYVVDDMLPQSNWPGGHEKRVADFIEMLEKRSYLTITKMRWSTGIIIAVKTSK